ncbi:cytochrome c biogenesis protein CcsA [Lacinutrix salivirga]
MQNILAKILFSTRLTAVLFLVFAAAMITGTFLDAGQETSPTPFTNHYIYKAWWFEAIMIFFIINFIGNIFRYRLLRKEKWATLILHLAFILILIGAGITRHTGFEGMMSIREGETENTFLSTETYITAYIDGDYEIDGVQQRLVREWEVDFSERLSNKFEKTAYYNGQPITIKVDKFITGAEEDVIPGDTGDEYLKIVEAGGGMPHNHLLKMGTVQNIHNILFALNKPTEGAINITHNDGNLTIESPYEGEYMQMATGNTGQLIKDSLQPLMLRSRYVIGNMQMVFPKPVIKGEIGVVKKSQMLKNDKDGVILSVTRNEETKQVGLIGGKGTSQPFEQIKVGGHDVMLKYGSKVLDLPFDVKLNDFIAERYPGTENSYSSYESKVTVLDKEEGDFDFHIYMNNILKHRGYRFFQASFDPDEKGTILSVNHDEWGTWTTYAGYSLLYFGLLAILFSKHTRFNDLRNRLEKVKSKKSKLLSVLFLAFTLQAAAQTEHFDGDGHDHQVHKAPSKTQIDSILKANVAPKAHANKFGRMVIQDVGGRMMPINTYASEMLRKLTKKDTYEDLSADQVFLSIHESPLLWYNVPVIYIKPRKGDSIRRIIGLDKTEEFATLADFFTNNGIYKLGPYLNEAYKTQVPNAIQKEMKEADQRVNLLYNTVEGRSLKIFPVPEDENNKWISSLEYREEGFKDKIKDSLYGNFINTGFSYYLYMLNEAKKSGDYTAADKLLGDFKKTQQKFGEEVMLSDEKVNAEVLYNKYDIFRELFMWCMLAGLVLFALIIVQIFYDNSKLLNLVITILKVIIMLLFLAHTGGLIWRWYISGHAPWSDGYESMIYVAWATLFFGLALSNDNWKMTTKLFQYHKNNIIIAIVTFWLYPLAALYDFFFGKKSSELTIAATVFVASMLLMIAHWSWMDPAIANLQPVLNSYWLKIHVSVIVASYGPFTLGFILGVVSLILMILTNEKNKTKMQLHIKELTIINEMALTVGLILLTIGNFLGGQWANESWGRYWGWDPKETWALISIMIYAFVIHMRLVPGLRGRWTFNLWAVISIAFIIFTYFGVNFYLSGLHSYQSGQDISLMYIGVAVVLVAILGFFSRRKYMKYYKK